MTSRSKGNRNRRACITLLEQQGFVVDVVEKTSRFAKIKDLFGLFDIVAISSKKVVFIQVTTNSPHSHQPLSDFKALYPFVGVAQYVWYDYKGFKVFTYSKDGLWDYEKIAKKKKI